MKNEPIATGRVEGLCINGVVVLSAYFDFRGPVGDKHSELTRHLSGHDGGYIRTSDLKKGDVVINCRQWTALSKEELLEIEHSLGCIIPPGCLLENLVISGVPEFSRLLSGSRLVFPKREHFGCESQLILAVWEENNPCHVVGRRLQDHHGIPGLSTKFISSAQHRRGVMGFVFSPGPVEVGDEVVVYPPMQ